MNGVGESTASLAVSSLGATGAQEEKDQLSDGGERRGVGGYVVATWDARECETFCEVGKRGSLLPAKAQGLQRKAISSDSSVFRSHVELFRRKLDTERRLDVVRPRSIICVLSGVSRRGGHHSQISSVCIYHT